MAYHLALAFMIYIPLVLATSYHGATPLKRKTHSLAAHWSRSEDLESGKDSDAYHAVATAWYAGWHGTDSPPSSVSWDKYSSVKYAFATTTPNTSVIALLDSDKALLPVFVHTAHENDVAAILTVGGWTGSLYFSTAVGSAANRTIFVDAILNLVSTYDLDGINFDWEYPGKQGIGCNEMSLNDSANFLSFLQELRSHECGEKMTLSATVAITPFTGADGNPMVDVSAFAKVLDYIEIMNYDVWGDWDTTVGPNAPLNDTCAPVVNQAGSAVSAIKAWTSANFPVCQIILGVASYGHSFFVPRSIATAPKGDIAEYPVFNKSLQPSGDKWDDAAGVDECGTATSKGGIFDFWGMVDGGFLDAKGMAAKGIDYRYDNCSQTPYVYNATSEVMISYDDATSFAAKGHFIRDMGLKGFSMWESEGDYKNILLDSISKAAGIL